MSDSSSNANLVAKTEGYKYDRTVEEILRMRFSLALLLEPIANAVAAKFGAPEPAISEIQVERRRLLALSPSELAREYSREAAALEARQFYNVTPAMADFQHWSQMDFWNVEETVALLLGREPTVVNSASLKNHQTSAFAKQYTRLLQLAKRAEALGNPDRIRPADALDWALMTQVVAPPIDLERCVRLRARLAERNGPKALPAPQSTVTPSPVAPPSVAPALMAWSDPMPPAVKKWTPERLKELSDYRERHGTKAAAKHFGIGESRVRQLLPQEAPAQGAASVFTYRPK